MTIEEIKEAIDQYFSDTSRSQSGTKAGLEDIISHCEIYVDSLEASDNEVDEDDDDEVF